MPYGRPGEAQARRPPATTCHVPKRVLSVAWPSQCACAHTHACTHPHACVPMSGSILGEFDVCLKRDQFSLYNIYFLKKPKSSSVVGGAGELGHPGVATPMPIMVTKLEGSMERRRRRGGAYIMPAEPEAGGGERRGEGPGGRRLDPGGRGTIVGLPCI